MKKKLSNLFKSFAPSQSLIRDVVCNFPNSFVEANAQKRPWNKLYLINPIYTTEKTEKQEQQEKMIAA